MLADSPGARVPAVARVADQFSAFSGVSFPAWRAPGGDGACTASAAALMLRALWIWSLINAYARSCAGRFEAPYPSMMTPRPADRAARTRLSIRAGHG